MKLLVVAGICVQMIIAALYNNPSKELVEMPVHKVQNSFALTGRLWQMQEIRFLQENTPYYYHRDDRKKNTIDLDDDFILFNDDGTGVYHQSDGVEFELQWKAKNQDANFIEYTIKRFRKNQDLIVNWEHIEFENGAISYTEFYKHVNGVESLAVATRSCKTEIGQIL